MQKKEFKYLDKRAYDYVISELKRNGVTVADIADIAFSYEEKYMQGLTKKDAYEAVNSILHKREVANAAMVGINLDKIATNGLLDEPLQYIVEEDAGVFGVDELLAFGIANLYGMVGSSNFGFADKEKTGIIKQLDTVKGEKVNTFIDDIVGAIAAAAAARASGFRAARRARRRGSPF